MRVLERGSSPPRPLVVSDTRGELEAPRQGGRKAECYPAEAQQLLDKNASGRPVEVTPTLRDFLVTTRRAAGTGDASDLDFAAADILREVLL